jgi:cytochrome c oxidase subunit 3
MSEPTVAEATTMDVADASEMIVANHPAVAHHFDDWEQQYDSCVLGMWVFLVSEVMFFGGLFATYMVYRFKFPEAFDHASEHLDIWLGGFNTFALLTSSLTMALAVRAAHLGQSRQIALMISLTMALGLVFLGVKSLEYYHKYEDGLAPLLGLGLPFRYEGAEPGPTQLFYGLYFAMTGVHALHMIIGIAILGLFIRPALRGAYSGANSLSVEIIGLYWHFVDLVWIFLFPLLYLIDRSA